MRGWGRVTACAPAHTPTCACVFCTWLHESTRLTPAAHPPATRFVDWATAQAVNEVDARAVEEENAARHEAKSLQHLAAADAEAARAQDASVRRRADASSAAAFAARMEELQGDAARLHALKSGGLHTARTAKQTAVDKVLTVAPSHRLMLPRCVANASTIVALVLRC